MKSAAGRGYFLDDDVTLQANNLGCSWGGGLGDEPSPARYEREGTRRDGHERGKHVSLLSRFEPDTRDELSVIRRIIHASIHSVLLAKTNYEAKFV